MTKTDTLFQPHYLKEERAHSFDVIAGKDLKWECLGPNCPSSCCNKFAYSRISFNEIVPLSKYFPIVFCAVERADKKKEIALCILMKIIKDDNYCTYLEKGVGCLLQDKKPLTCRQYPFSVIENRYGNTDLSARLNCPGFSEEYGHQVIAEGEGIAACLERECINPAISRYNALEETERFVETVNNCDLIVPGQYNYRGESISFNLIDAKRLYSLPKIVLDEFRAKGYMELINAHMSSLVSNGAKLIDVYLERTSTSKRLPIMLLLLKPGFPKSRRAA